MCQLFLMAYKNKRQLNDSRRLVLAARHCDQGCKNLLPSFIDPPLTLQIHLNPAELWLHQISSMRIQLMMGLTLFNSTYCESTKGHSAVALRLVRVRPAQNRLPMIAAQCIPVRLDPSLLLRHAHKSNNILIRSRTQYWCGCVPCMV